jgi:serine/threonine-protein kinase RsbW
MEPITVPGRLDSLKAIATYVMSAAEQAGLEKKEAYKLRLAIDEIATNIILHGYEEAGLTGNIELTTQLSETAITITLEDSAIPYDPLQHNHPNESDLQQSLAERKLGGLGVFLAVDGVDDFAYEFINNCNRNHFTINRSVANLTR